TASPDCRVTRSGNRRIGGPGRYPKINIGIVPAAAVERDITCPTPDDHVASGPDCCVTRSGIRRVANASGCPRVRAGVVSATGIKKEIDSIPRSAPDDHFAARPDSGVRKPGARHVGSAGGCPTIRAEIVSPAGVQSWTTEVGATPDNHFTAGPNCRVIYSP